MRLFMIFISLLFAGRSFSQSSTILHEWYNIGFDGLMHYTFNGKYLIWEEQSFSFAYKDGKKGGEAIIAKYKKDNLTCLIAQDSIDGKTIFRGTVIREQGVTGAMDLIMNCNLEDYSDTAELKKSFYSCDSSKFMIIRCYDRKSIEAFRKLKDIHKISAEDYKKAHNLYKSAVTSLKNQFSNEDLWLVDYFLHRQKLTDILVAAGYNPLIDDEELNKFFSLY